MAPLADDGSIIGLVGMTVDRTAQVEAENRLKESEARLKAAIDALPFPFFICDAEGRHIMQNRSDRELWGDAIGKTSAETGLPPEIVAHMPRALERVQAGETVRELLRYHCNGQLRDIEEIYAPVRTDQGIAGFVGLAIDHTERTAAEERVRRSEARLAAYLATASDWLWETDEAHRLVSLSGWPAYFEVSAEKLLGQTRWAFAGVDPATDPAWQMHFVDLQARRPFRRFVYPYARSNAPPVWIEVSGDPFFDEIGDFRGYRGTARDVTEQRRAMQALSEAHAKLEAMTISGLIGITNGHGFLIEDANDAFLEMLGRDRSELRDGLDWRQLVPPDDVSEEVAAADIRRSSGDSYTTETAYRHADGHYVPVLLNVVVLDGEEQRWFALIQDLTPMKLAESQIRELAERDPLTGLANRHVLFERLAGDLGERRAPGTKGALMLLDLDGFKEINDSHGHQAGDHLLRLIGDRLKIRPARHRHDRQGRRRRVRGHRSRAARRRQCRGRCRQDPLGAARADDARPALGPPGWQHRRLPVSRGRPRARRADEEGRHRSLRGEGRGPQHLSLLRAGAGHKDQRAPPDPRGAAAGKAAESFSIELQPQRHLGSGRLVGLEALVRWQLDGRPLMPEAFIGLAEETGLIVALGQIVRRQALEAMRCLDEAGVAAGSIAVNVSTAELERPDFATEIDQLLDELAISPDRLAIEVSETMLDDHRIDGVGGSIDALRRLGISVVLDNFGRGHGIADPAAAAGFRLVEDRPLPHPTDRRRGGRPLAGARHHRDGPCDGSHGRRRGRRDDDTAGLSARSTAATSCRASCWPSRWRSPSCWPISRPRRRRLDPPNKRPIAATGAASGLGTVRHGL